MPDVPNPINPQSLKALREQRDMTQQQLADDIGCTKDTVSRWERGKTQRVRSHLHDPLCKALRVEWKKLTAEPDTQTGNILSVGDSKVTVRKDVRNALELVAERFNVRSRAVLELAPLLFLIVAERSLLERKRRLEEIEAAFEEVDKKILDNCAHLGRIVAVHHEYAENHLYEEEESLRKRDVFGRTIEYEDYDEDHEGPFVHFVRGLVKDLPKDAVTDIDSYGGDMIESYRIADDTLRECTGVSRNEESGQELLDYIHCGSIDFAECLLTKRNKEGADYRQWLSDELVRAKEENARAFRELGF